MVALLVSYYCAIPEAKRLSAVCHGVAAKTSFARCMVTADDIIGSEMEGDRSVRYTKMIEIRSLIIPMNNTVSVQDGNAISQEQEGEFDQPFWRNKSPQT